MTTQNNQQIEPCPINDDPILFSLLYDLDLLPEKVKEGTPDWVRMNVIIEHWNRRANQPKETPSASHIQNLSIMNDQVKLIHDLESQLEDYRKALEDAIEQLELVNDGTDFEVECWKVAQQCRICIGMPNEE